MTLRFSTVLAGVASVAAVGLLAAEAAEDGAAKFREQLAAMKDVRTLQSGFVCEKRVAGLDWPLVSGGRFWMRKGDGKVGGAGGGGGMRLVTERPYMSDLIFAGGKVFARSQHETEWSQTNQAVKPGLTTVLLQLGGWSMGDAGKSVEMYAVTARRGDVPPCPGADEKQMRAAKGAELFELTPVDKDLLVAVKRVTLALDTQTHGLTYVEIVTQQEDVVRYWFFEVQVNTAVAADVFKPGVPPADAGAKGR
jgi:outer membrane lipoprotein-sorting protein